MDLLTSEEAAEQLGLSARRVRALIAQGDLAAVQVGRARLVSPESVALLRRTRAAGRSLSARTSWVVLLSNLGSTDFDSIASKAGMSRAERQRALALRDRPVEDWSWLARRRAVTTRYRIREAYVDRLLADKRVVRSGVSALQDFGIDATSQRRSAEAYITLEDAADVLTDYGLRVEQLGGLVLHVVEHVHRFGDALDGRTVMTAATVGVDLAESDDVRMRRLGYELLGRLAGG